MLLTIFLVVLLLLVVLLGVILAGNNVKAEVPLPFIHVNINNDIRHIVHDLFIFVLLLS